MSIAPARSIQAPLDGAISSTTWGHLPGGEPVRLFTLRNGLGMRVSISDLGATLVSWQAPDRGGRLGEILLNHASPAAYLESAGYLGGLIGRWANRIAGARFTLEGIDYTLDRNEGGNLLQDVDVLDFFKCPTKLVGVRLRPHMRFVFLLTGDLECRRKSTFRATDTGLAVEFGAMIDNERLLGFVVDRD